MSNIKSVKFIGKGQTYDIGVNHKDHQFYMSNGMLTSNSHAVLYSMISFQTAYLKAHFPIEFLLANLMFEVKSATQDAPANIQKIKNELRQHKIKIAPADINKSNLTFTMENNTLLTGLDALKFVGDDAIIDILEQRPYTSFFDFMNKTSGGKVRAGAIQALAASGALDSFKLPRKAMFLYCSDYRKKLQVWLKKHDPSKEKFEYPWDKSEWKLSELFAMETKYMGEGFICKPYRAYDNFFKVKHTTISNIRKLEDKDKFSSFKCILRDTFEFTIKKEKSKFYGMAMLKAVVEDMNGDVISMTVFPDRLENLKATLKKKRMELENGIGLNIVGSVNHYEDDIGIVLNDILEIAEKPKEPDNLKQQKVSLRDPLKKESKSFDDIEDELVMEGVISSEDKELE